MRKKDISDNITLTFFPLNWPLNVGSLFGFHSSFFYKVNRRGEA